MNSFDFLNYHTEYSVKGDYNLKMHTAICFREVFFEKGIKTQRYSIKVYKGYELVTKTSSSNFCLLTKQQLNTHLGFLKKIIKNIKIYTNDCDKYFLVNVTLTGGSLVHRFVLTWIRYVYEYPYNVVTLCSMENKKHFPKLTLFDMYNLVQKCISFKFYGDGHTITQREIFYKFIPIETLKKMEKDAESFKGEYILHDYFIRFQTAPLNLEKFQFVEKNEEGVNNLVHNILPICKENYKIIKNGNK